MIHNVLKKIVVLLYFTLLYCLLSFILPSCYNTKIWQNTYISINISSYILGTTSIFIHYLSNSNITAAFVISSLLQHSALFFFCPYLHIPMCGTQHNYLGYKIRIIWNVTQRLYYYIITDCWFEPTTNYNVEYFTVITIMFILMFVVLLYMWTVYFTTSHKNRVQI